MSYRDQLSKMIQEIKDYKKVFDTNYEEALKFKNTLPMAQKAYHVHSFFRSLRNSSAEWFGSKEAYEAFLAKHPDLFPDGKMIHVPNFEPYGDIKLPDVDFEKIFDALDEEFKENPQKLEELYNHADPKIREVNHPMQGVIDSIKEDARRFYEEGPLLNEVLETLDYANNELVEKTGEHLLDNAIDANANARSVMAVKHFDSFVEENGLDKKKIVNRSHRDATISPNFASKGVSYSDYKPFLSMEVHYPEDFKEKLLNLDTLLQDEGLLTKAQGGESGNKEYGLADYFQANYTLKKALTDYTKLTNDEEKQAALLNIRKLTQDVKDVTAKYEKVFNYIKENFDLDNISMSANLYSGRPSSVPDGDLTNWKPNLPEKFDFENSQPVIFLSGFTQLKAACQITNSSLKDYLDHPHKTYLDGAKKLAEHDDNLLYITPAQEPNLGKRMARAFCGPSNLYNGLYGYNMAGGRGMEFLYNTVSDKANQDANIIKSSVIKEYSTMYGHDPAVLFDPTTGANIQNLKNLFAAGDQFEHLYEASDRYFNENGDCGCKVKDYPAAVKTHGNTSVADEYRRIMQTVKDFNDERVNLGRNPQQYYQQGNLNPSVSSGAILAAGREYFVDYMRENNLSLASIQDAKLRNEVIDFINDPIAAYTKKNGKFDLDDGPERDNEVSFSFRRTWEYKIGKNNTFFEKFAEHNRKPGGYNTGKTMAKILSDNKGSWWERLRGKTSKEYSALQKIAKASIDPTSRTKGDKEAMYVAAKAYKEYKMPEGTNFDNLSKTAKKRIEFCDSIIEAYEAEKREKELANQPQPVVENNNIIPQDDFQKQLAVDMAPKESNKVQEAPAKEEKANEKENVIPNEL